jgi:hypothetical protein
MNATVYTSQGARICRARWAGRDLNDWDVADKGRLWVPGCRALNLYAVEPTTIPDAMGDGKLPRGVCMPDLLASWFRSPSEDDFGHEPVTETGYYGPEQVCARCDRIGAAPYLSALWPCMSAVVLGLAPRPADVLELTA